MKIVKVESFPISVSLKEAFVMSKSTTTSVLSLIIKITTESGL